MLLRICFLSLLLSACGQAEHSRVQVGGPGVIAGDDPLNRYTVLVKLAFERGDRLAHGHCSGTLLSPEHVLLAAHCVENVWSAKVLIGHEHKVTLANGSKFTALSEGKSLVVSKSFLAYYEKKFYTVLLKKLTWREPRQVLKDIAIIRLAQPFDLPYGIEFTIPEPNRDLSGEQVDIAGYGIGDFAQQPNRGRKATVTLKRDYQVSDLLEFTNYTDRVNFGDSGGPVWWRNEEGQLNLIGVHSFGLPLPLPLPFYTYSIDIRQHQKWIGQALRVLHQRQPRITAAMDMSKRFFPSFLEENYQGD